MTWSEIGKQNVQGEKVSSARDLSKEARCSIQLAFMHHGIYCTFHYVQLGQSFPLCGYTASMLVEEWC